MKLKNIKKSEFMSSNEDLYEKDHWESFWTFSKPRFFNKLNYYNSILDKYFRSVVRENSKVLEVGCGGSIWLPYFKQYLKFLQKPRIRVYFYSL